MTGIFFPALALLTKTSNAMPISTSRMKVRSIPSLITMEFTSATWHLIGIEYISMLGLINVARCWDLVQVYYFIAIF
jgi:hypothetical protein